MKKERPHFIAYPCETCGAKPNEKCRTRTGVAYRFFHDNRIWKGIEDGWKDDGQ